MFVINQEWNKKIIFIVSYFYNNFACLIFFTRNIIEFYLIIRDREWRISSLVTSCSIRWHCKALKEENSLVRLVLFCDWYWYENVTIDLNIGDYIRIIII